MGSCVVEVSANSPPANSLVAVGDEDGFVRLLDTCPSQNPDFSRVHLSFQTHGNAVIDVAFSEDDSLLGTASGDQLGKVFDMMTQTPIAVLSAHSASLKQIRFQPGAAMGKVLATSSRDGSVQIWDLRCRGPPVQEIVIEREERLGFRLPPKFQAGCIVNSMYGAHAPSRASTLRSSHALQALGGPAESGSSGAGDRPSRGEKPGRLGDVSVTAIQFLPAPGREHLLLTACEADASMKLWDVRAINNNYGSSGSSRGGHGRASAAYMPATPLAFTAPPPGHVAWRPFGITSIVLSTDGARAYALCKDNTVYAYSTQHLVLGHAPPEFAGSTLNFQGDDSAGAVASSSLYTHHHSRRRLTPAHEGLGPLYGLRHPLLHATSFYVKLALRPARHGHSELLAAGSSDGSAVLFPTDERWLFHSGPGRISDAAAATPTPIITHLGTPLVRGHTREVGALCFTASVSNPCETGGDRGGRLVTVADDFAIRRWSEHDVPGLAADLRSGGEGGGRRWQCGWAETRRGVWMGTEVFGDEAGAWSGDEIDEW